MTRIKLGGVTVDSGQIMLIDPCYVIPDGKEYDRICDADEGEFDFPGMTGVKVGTQVGDGVFPAYAVYNDRGELAKIEIKIRGE